MRLTPIVLGMCALVACSPSETLRRVENPLLVIGWDGATFDLIDPMIEAGRLPNLRQLIGLGASADLMSTVIPISSAAWVAAVSGKGPGDTGVYSFFEPVEGGIDVRLIDSRSNRATPIWRTLTRAGLRANVIGVPITWPPEPVLGTLVSGMLSPFDSVYAWPAEVTDELRARGFVPDLGIWRDQPPLSAEFIDKQLKLKEAFLLEQLGRDDWDFTMVVFKSLDVLSHRVFDLRLDGRVAKLLERLDAILGRLVAEAGPDANVIVLSDHGFATYPRAFNLHAWLISAGFSQRRVGSAPSGLAAGPLAETRALAHRERMGQLDHARTRAYATACEGNYGSIRLNLRGREAEGSVAPAHRADVLSKIETALGRVLTADGKHPLVTQVFNAVELYPGPHRRAIPDLMIEVRPDVQVVCNSLTPEYFEHPRPAPDHSRRGMWVIAGPGVHKRSKRGKANISDLAPTALHLLDQQVYSEMSGRVLTDLTRNATPRFVAEGDLHLDRRIDWPSDGERGIGGEAVRERLKMLGYTD